MKRLSYRRYFKNPLMAFICRQHEGGRAEKKRYLFAQRAAVKELVAPHSHQLGFMQVTLVILMGLFMTFSALALDLGNLYLWKLRAKKAAHAGAMAGLGFRVNNGWKNTQLQKTQLDGLVAQTVQANFDMYGAQGAPTVTTTYDEKTDTVSVSIAYAAQTFFVGRLNGFFNFGLQRGSSTVALRDIQSSARLNPATILLLLDVSGSMTRDISNLINGVTTFLAQFNPNTDHISIIPFNIGAQVQFPLTKGGNIVTFDLAAMTNYVNSLSSATKSNTNHCDALTEAISDLQQATTPLGRAGDPYDIRPSVVLFTDGAPNAMRGTFNVYPPGSSTAVSQDAYLYSVEWFDGQTTTPYSYRGPGPIVYRPGIGLGVKNDMFGFQITNTSIAPSGPPPWTTCGPNFATDLSIVSDPTQFRSILDRNKADRSGLKKGCLDNLDFTIPYTNGAAKVTGIPFESPTGTSTRDRNWPPRFFNTPAPPYYYQYFDQLPYYCAIEAADYIRKVYGATIYTIGYGAPVMPSSTDPFQDADLSDSQDPANPGLHPRKDFFLARLAKTGRTRGANGWASSYDFFTKQTISVNSMTSPNHRYAASGSPSLVIGNTSSAQYPDILDPAILQDSAGRRHSTTGEYFPTMNPNDLPEIYRRIARSILLRAVQ